MPVKVQLLECLASPHGTWQAGDFFDAVDQAEADLMFSRGLAVPIPGDVEQEQEAPKPKKSRKGGS